MSTEPTVRKLMQVAEEAQAPIHVPVVLGNECYVMTQQDVRRVEDMRLISYSKLNEKGELVPLDALRVNCNAKDVLTNAATCRMQQQQQQQQQLQPCVPMNTSQMNLLNILTRVCNPQSALQQTMPQQQTPNVFAFNQPNQPNVFSCGNQPNMFATANQPNMFQSSQLQCAQQPIPMITVTPAPPTAYAPCQATLQQQLNWANAGPNTLTPVPQFPFHRTSATSTTDISRSQRLQQRRNACFSRGCNTMDVDDPPRTTRSATYLNIDSNNSNNNSVTAHQQLKQRKMARFLN